MKKVITVIATVMMTLALNIAVMAAPSPNGDVINDQEEQTKTEAVEQKSPKTAESSVLFVEIAGAALAVTAVCTGLKAKRI